MGIDQHQGRISNRERQRWRRLLSNQWMWSKDSVSISMSMRRIADPRVLYKLWLSIQWRQPCLEVTHWKISWDSRTQIRWRMKISHKWWDRHRDYRNCTRISVQIMMRQLASLVLDLRMSLASTNLVSQLTHIISVQENCSMIRILLRLNTL